CLPRVRSPSCTLPPRVHYPQQASGMYPRPCVQCQRPPLLHDDTALHARPRCCASCSACITACRVRLRVVCVPRLLQLVLVVGDMHIPHRAVDIADQFKKILVRAHARRRARVSWQAAHVSTCACTCVCTCACALACVLVCVTCEGWVQVPNKVQHVLCTGNMVTSEQLDYLRTLAPRVHVVRGDFDEDGTACAVVVNGGAPADAYAHTATRCAAAAVPFHTALRRSAPRRADTLPETKVVSVGEFKIGLCHGHQLAPVGEPQSLALLRRQLDVDVLVTGATHRNSILEYDGHCFVNPGSITGAYNPSTDIGEITPSFMLMSIQEAKIEFFLYEISAAGKLKVTRSSYTKPESGLAV
ncbi:YfcE family phosphodiesterase, partial [archaeon]